MTHSDFVCEVYRELSPRRGVWNMALDEALLERCLEHNVSHVRVYRWLRPTVSLGYFQEYLPETIPENLRSLEVVRRLSGGGAILHHHELTYSCAVPPDHPLAKTPSEVYRLVHQSLVELFRGQSVESAMRGDALDFPEGEPFLCYSRGDQNDVLCRGYKIIGSAQRRRRGAILQHGSILQKRSPHAPEFPGLEDLYPGATLVDQDDWVAELCDRLADLFGRPELKSEIDPALDSRARHFESEKYCFPARRFARGSEFEVRPHGDDDEPV